MRVTNALIKVAMAMMSDPHAKQWGYDLSRQSSVRSGVMYPILARMLEDGWLTDGWEDPAKLTEKRPPRRYYELTDDGLRELGAIVKRAELDARQNVPSLRPSVA